MFLNSIFQILNLHANPRGAAKAVENDAPDKAADDGEPFSKVVEKVRIPAGEATLAAASEAKGMKKIELEIAAAAGLLRPISPEPPRKTTRPVQGLDTLLRTVDELKNPPKSPNLDLFE
jgi:hypothetical protein